MSLPGHGPIHTSVTTGNKNKQIKSQYIMAWAGRYPSQIQNTTKKEHTSLTPGTCLLAFLTKGPSFMRKSNKPHNIGRLHLIGCWGSTASPLLVCLTLTPTQYILIIEQRHGTWPKICFHLPWKAYFSTNNWRQAWKTSLQTRHVELWHEESLEIFTNPPRSRKYGNKCVFWLLSNKII